MQSQETMVRSSHWVLDQLGSSVEQVGPDMLVVISKHAVDSGIDPTDIVENGILR
jgi:aromatic ring-opening dioxygenase catalytic subunit (LigB family)